MTLSRLDLRPEDRLLLHCARTQLRPEDLEAIGALVTQVDWQLLFASAERHRVTPLLAHSLASAPLPPERQRVLQETLQQQALHNLVMAAELLKVLSRFRASGISAVPLKGPVLASGVYGNLALRPFGDLDILVRKSDVGASRILLTASGYNRWDEGVDEAQHLERGYQDNFVRTDGGVVVELHWGITRRHFAVGLEPAALWERLSETRFLDKTVQTLAAEDLVLVLCIHGARHLWDRLIWVCDIAEVLRTLPVAWEGLLARAAQLGTERILLTGLLLAHTLLGAALPPAAASRVAEISALAPLVERLARRLFQPAPPLKNLYDTYTLYFGMRERWPDRLRLVAPLTTRILGPSDEERARMPLPPFLSFLYLPLKPFLRSAKERRES